MGPVRERLGGLEEAVNARLQAFIENRLVERIWKKDPRVWSDDEGAASAIENRLGWLTVLDPMKQALEEIEAIVEDVKEQGFVKAVLLGMGGSSLAPEVLRETFGAAEGFVDLRVLDSTDPDAVRAAEEWAVLPRTLFIVSSKSGTTAETTSFYDYFAGRGVQGGQCIAITDAGTPLEELARREGFHHTFVNPADIGGRYSALSYFGLVPAALVGVDVDHLLDAGARAANACSAANNPERNPGLRLGVALGEACRAGRDKLTLMISPGLETFGAWVEQLVAESTGKDGTGILPVHDEPAMDPAEYGSDRLFFYLRDSRAPDAGQDRRIEALAEAGHPTYGIDLDGPHDLGYAFFLWELATAVCGAVLGINPFDEPDVKDSKTRTAGLLEQYQHDPAIGTEGLLLEADGLRFYADESLRPPVEPTIADLLVAHLRRAGPNDYVGLLAYLHATEAVSERLASMREKLLSHRRLATTLGIGPRFLHSTGQLFKGGPNTGIFLQLIHKNDAELDIPHRPYGFGVLKRAQALGDFEALVSRGRRVVRCEIEGDLRTGLRRLEDELAQALERL